MEGDGEFIINNGIHKGKCQYGKILLRQQTCDGGDSIVVEQSVRQGTNDDGVGIGIVEAKGLLLQCCRQRQGE
jgi:hypothetical protein